MQAPGIRFLETSPTSDAFEGGLDRRLQRDRASFDLQERMRNSAEQQGTDDAIRSGLNNITARPQGDAPAQPAAMNQAPDDDGAGVAGSPVGNAGNGAGVPSAARTPGINPGAQPSVTPNIGGAIAALTRVPGGGAKALELAKGERTRDDDGQRQAMIALAGGDRAGFDYWSQRSNLRLPPEVLQDGQRAGLFAKGMLIAEKSYKDDPQQAQAFTRAYVMSGGNTDQAFTAAGAPRSKPHMTVHNVREGDQQVTYLLDQTKMMRGSSFKDAATELGRGAAWKPFGAGGAGGANTQVGLANFIARSRAQAQGREATADDVLQALQEVKGAQSNPTTRAGLEIRLYQNLLKEDSSHLYSTDEEKRANARQMVEDALSHAGQPAPGAPAVRAPAAPAAAPPGPVSFSIGGGAAYSPRTTPPPRIASLTTQPLSPPETSRPLVPGQPPRTEPVQTANQPAAAPLTSPRPSYRYNPSTFQLEPVR